MLEKIQGFTDLTCSRSLLLLSVRASLLASSSPPLWRERPSTRPPVHPSLPTSIRPSIRLVDSLVRIYYTSDTVLVSADIIMNNKNVFLCMHMYIDRYIYMYVCLVSQACPTLWGSIAHQAPLSMEFSRQIYWSGLPFPTPGDLSSSGIEPRSPAFPELAGRFFTTSITWEAPHVCVCVCVCVCVNVFCYTCIFFNLKNLH